MTETQESAKAAGREPRRPAKRRRPKRSARLAGVYSSLAANYLRFVNATCPLAYEPADFRGFAGHAMPVIVTMWHGQSFMLPFARPKDIAFDILVSRHGDGELIARTLQKLGCGIVRGSGSRQSARALQRGGASAFMAMRSRLQDGVSIALTADFDTKAPRHAGLGVVMLARASGRPVVPTAIATSRRIEMKSWDRSVVNLPFGRAACVFGGLIEVPASADDALLEEKRREVEDALNAATARAYEIAERRHG